MATSKTAREALGMGGPATATEDVQLPGVASPDASQIDIFTPTERDGSKALTLEDAIQWMRDHYVEEDADTEEALKRIAADILNSGSADEVLTSGQTTKAEQVFNIPLLVESCKYYESDEEYQGGIGWFVAIQVRRSDTREDDVITCGAWSVVLQCVRLHMLGAFPRVVKIKQKERKTRNGYRPLALTLPV